MVASVRVARPRAATGRKESDDGDESAKSAGKVGAERKLRVAAQADADVRATEDTVERPERDTRTLASISNPLCSTKESAKERQREKVRSRPKCCRSGGYASVRTTTEGLEGATHW